MSLSSCSFQACVVKDLEENLLLAYKIISQIVLLNTLVYIPQKFYIYRKLILFQYFNDQSHEPLWIREWLLSHHNLYHAGVLSLFFSHFCP